MSNLLGEPYRSVTSPGQRGVERTGNSNFTVDAIAFEGDVNTTLKNLLFKKGFDSLEQLAAQLSLNGYKMGTPHTVEGHQNNYAHMEVLKQGKKVAMLTIEAIAPLHGPLSLDEPEE